MHLLTTPVTRVSLVRELALTARNMEASEALTSGFVRCAAAPVPRGVRCCQRSRAPNLALCSKVCPDKDTLLVAALETAQRIAAMSPVAVMGTKDNLNFAREHSTSSSLSYIVRCAWRPCMHSHSLSLTGAGVRAVCAVRRLRGTRACCSQGI